MEEQKERISKSLAVTSCTAMSVFYVAILFSPTLLRLPPPDTLKTFLIRRFVCAAISSVLSILLCAILLPTTGWEASDLSGVYGIRLDHMWQAVLYPLLLTSLIYAGSFVVKLKLLLSALKEQRNHSEEDSSYCGANVLQIFVNHLSPLSYDVTAWRIYFVAPLTEELVFRACMIPLLLCGGFGTFAVMFFCPIFFSLAHLSHFLEIYNQQNRNLLKASIVIGLQLGYTVVFGSYASFLFIRTGHLIAPLFAHIFCNVMGLPVLYAPRNGSVSFAFVGGVLGFIWLLFPATNPGLYNDRTDSCSCWQRFCTWN